MFRFKELIELWRSDNLLTQALSDSHEMLKSTREMFRESVKSLRESDEGEMGINVYEKDQMVNEYERKVRRKVLKHLVITGGANIIPGLILTTIIVDIERIGDYTKNIMDLAVAHPKRLNAAGHEEQIQKIETSVMELFERGIPAFETSDRSVARQLFHGHMWMTKACDEILDGLIREKEPSLSAGDAVSAAMYTRYLKRITAHILNIMTSVINPFERISFREDEDFE